MGRLDGIKSVRSEDASIMLGKAQAQREGIGAEAFDDTGYIKGGRMADVAVMLLIEHHHVTHTKV